MDHIEKVMNLFLMRESIICEISHLIIWVEKGHIRLKLFDLRFELKYGLYVLVKIQLGRPFRWDRWLP